MLLIIKDDKNQVADWVAEYIIHEINAKMSKGKGPFVLGLPTGSTPLSVYQRLIERYNTGQISFENVVTFNMDEYVGLPEEHPQSYHYYMWENLFGRVDIPKENTNFLNGNAKDLDQECADYEEKIKKVGGIDLFLAGIGEDGHLAFNEPGSSLSSRTRDKNLNYDTIVANSRFFDDDVSQVPKKALTVGVGTIMDAKEVLVISTGYNKAFALHKVVEEGVNHFWTASMLQLHPQCTIVCDSEATMDLKVGTVRYFKDIEIDSESKTKFSYRRTII